MILTKAIDKIDKKIKVVYICLEGRVGGAEKSLGDLVGELKDGYDITVLCPGGSEFGKWISQMGVKVESIGEVFRGGGIFRKGWYFFKTAWRCRKIIRGICPEIMHCNNIAAGIVGVFAGIGFGGRKIVHCRDMRGRGIFVRVCCFFCDEMIAVSKAVKYWLIKQGAKEGIISVVYNGIKNGADLKARGKFCNEKICFANVGQFVEWKRQTMFVEAAEILHGQREDVRFCIVGDDIFCREEDYKNRLIKKVEASEVGGCLSLMGWHRDMDEVWGQVDCLVHTADDEPFGRVIVEAMLRGIVVVAFNSGGCGEIVKDKVNGRIVERQCPFALAKVMMEIAGDRDKSRRIGEAGIARGREFSVEKTARGIVKIYERVLGRQ